MMTVLAIYSLLFLIFFVVSSLMILVSENLLKEVLLVSMLNVFFLASFLFDRLLKELALLHGKAILGHKPTTLKDFVDLGIDPATSSYSFKNLFKLATTKKPKK